MIDFDLEDDGALVAFQKPSFSATTLLNLKQNPLTSTLSASTDNSTQYVFNQFDYVSFVAADSDSGQLFIREIDNYRKIGDIDITVFEITALTFDENNSILYGLMNTGSGSGDTLITIDPATG